MTSQERQQAEEYRGKVDAAYLAMAGKIEGALNLKGYTGRIAQKDVDEMPDGKSGSKSAPVKRVGSKYKDASEVVSDIYAGAVSAALAQIKAEAEPPAVGVTPGTPAASPQPAIPGR